MGTSTSTVKAVSSWTPLNFREYLESREGKIWQREDTRQLLKRAEEIDTLIVQLMRATGVEIVK
jgi:hypothetical protein